VSDSIIDVTDDSFESEVLNSDIPVLIDYWAEWCAPCKRITPILEELQENYTDKLKIVKFNIDDNQSIPPKYAVRGIPTLMILKNGEVEDTKVGALTKAQLTAFIDSNI